MKHDIRNLLTTAEVWRGKPQFVLPSDPFCTELCTLEVCVIKVALV